MYFVAFIDDFFRCTWVYLLKERFDVYNVFKSFYYEIKNQFGTYLKILRTYNVKEYVSHSFSSFYTSYGIIHQTSCAYTSQQNGVAERKNCHFLDVARTLLCQMNVPRSYWGHAVLISYFLINCMPSSLLQGQTPFSILYPNSHLFPLTSWIFGCTAFVHVHSQGRDKLAPRATKCVFLGYSPT